MITTLNDEVSTNSTKIAEQDTRLDQLDLKTYNSTTALTTYNEFTIPITVSALATGDYLFTPKTSYFDVDGYPLFVTAKLGMSIYTDPDKTSSERVYMSVPFYVACVNNKTRISTFVCTYKPTYGANVDGRFTISYLTTKA